MNIKSIILAGAAVLALSAPALAVDPIVIHLFDIEDEDTVVTTSSKSVGSDSPAPSHAAGARQAKCDPMPTSYDDYYDFCKAAMFPASLSSQVKGLVTTSSSETTCTTTSYYKTFTYDGSGSIYNPGNWDASFSSNESESAGAC